MTDEAPRRLRVAGERISEWIRTTYHEAAHLGLGVRISPGALFYTANVSIRPQTSLSRKTGKWEWGAFSPAHYTLAGVPPCKSNGNSSIVTATNAFTLVDGCFGLA